MSNSAQRDRELASEIFRGESTGWYQQAVEVVARVRAEEREKIHRILKDALDNPDSEST